jgi:uncharacterized protein (DUF305 family)
MNTLFSVARLALLTSSLLGSALAQSSTAQNEMPGMDMSTPSPASSSMSMSSTDSTAALNRLSGKAFDRAFLSMMIAHHQAALAMSKAVLPLTRDAQVKGWAQSIVTSQQAEIGSMTALLKPLGGTDATMAAMMSPVKSMDQTVGAAKNPTQAFMEGMMPHHASAISMASLALQKSSSPAVLKLAQNIVLAQARELYQFRSWLLK